MKVDLLRSVGIQTSQPPNRNLGGMMATNVLGTPLRFSGAPSIFGSRLKRLAHTVSLIANAGGEPGFPSRGVIWRPRDGWTPSNSKVFPVTQQPSKCWVATPFPL